MLCHRWWWLGENLWNANVTTDSVVHITSVIALGFSSLPQGRYGECHLENVSPYYRIWVWGGSCAFLWIEWRQEVRLRLGILMSILRREDKNKDKSIKQQQSHIWANTWAVCSVLWFGQCSYFSLCSVETAKWSWFCLGPSWSRLALFDVLWWLCMFNSILRPSCEGQASF